MKLILGFILAVLSVSANAQTGPTAFGGSNGAIPMGPIAPGAVDFSTITAAIATKQNSFTGISSSCAAGFYLSSGTWVNGVTTGGGCVAAGGGSGTILYFDSNPVGAGSATCVIPVVGLLATDTILATSMRVQGATNAALIAWSAQGDDTLTFQFTADPGGLAVVRVAVKR